MFQDILGMKVIVSLYCYKTVIRVVGILDKNRPNNRAHAIFKKKVIHIPLIIRAGDMIICAPEAYEKLKKTVEEQGAELGRRIKKRLDNDMMDAFRYNLKPPTIEPEPENQFKFMPTWMWGLSGRMGQRVHWITGS